MRLKNKSELTTWTVEEIIDDMESQQADKGLYEQEEVDGFLYDIENKVSEALKEIEEIKGIDAIDSCKELLKEISDKLY